MIKLLLLTSLLFSPVQLDVPHFCRTVRSNIDNTTTLRCRAKPSHVVTPGLLDTIIVDVEAVARDGTNIRRYDMHFSLGELIHSLEHLKRWNYKWGDPVYSIRDNMEINGVINKVRELQLLIKPKTLAEIWRDRGNKL